MKHIRKTLKCLLLALAITLAGFHTHQYSYAACAHSANTRRSLRESYKDTGFPIVMYLDKVICGKCGTTLASLDNYVSICHLFSSPNFTGGNYAGVSEDCACSETGRYTVMASAQSVSLGSTYKNRTVSIYKLYEDRAVFFKSATTDNSGNLAAFADSVECGYAIVANDCAHTDVTWGLSSGSILQSSSGAGLIYEYPDATCNLCGATEVGYDRVIYEYKYTKDMLTETQQYGTGQHAAFMTTSFEEYKIKPKTAQSKYYLYKRYADRDEYIGELTPDAAGYVTIPPSTDLTHSYSIVYNMAKTQTVTLAETTFNKTYNNTTFRLNPTIS